MSVDTAASSRDLEAARPPFAVLATLWGVFCAAMIGVAVRDYFHDGGHHAWEPLLWEISSMLDLSALLVAQRILGRRYAAHLTEPRRWFFDHLKWLPLAVVQFVVVVYGIRHAVYAWKGLGYSHPPWLDVVTYEGLKVGLFIGLWLGVIFAFDSFAYVQAQQRRVLAMQRSLAEAHLAQLSAQLRPHFFFNVLNTVSALMHRDVQRADRLLSQLGELLRGSLATNSRTLHPLREELRLLDLYAQIMLARFADRIALHWTIDDASRSASVPALLLQPLLENAFKHGVELTRDPVRIQVDARRDGSTLRLTVINSGTLAPAGPREGMGLRNCRERLRTLYGEASSLTLTATSDEVRAEATLPWTEDRR